MISVIQRVLNACVAVNDNNKNSINFGLVIFIGIEINDTKNDADKTVDKILKLRIFEDNQEKMNLSALDVNAELLVVSQFTLTSNLKKGNRPSFDNAMPPAQAKELFDYCVSNFKKSGLIVKTGFFGEKMQVNILNNGPVTFILNSKI